jgi:hypothetical protein
MQHRLKNPDSPYHLDNQDTGYWMLEKEVDRAVWALTPRVDLFVFVKSKK